MLFKAVGVKTDSVRLIFCIFADKMNELKNNCFNSSKKLIVFIFFNLSTKGFYKGSSFHRSVINLSNG